MSTPNPYNPARIAELRKMVSKAENTSEALDILEKELELHRDSVRRLNRIYGIYGKTVPNAKLIEAHDRYRGGVKVDFGDVRKVISEMGMIKNCAARPEGRQIKRLFWDVEVSPNLVLSWRVGYKLNIDYSNIVKERAIITIAYKWEGEKTIYALHWDENQCDKKMLAEFLKVAEQADELVHHNGDAFDLPWLKTRCLFHGLTTIPDYKTVDTLQWARRKFLFNSNRLDYLGQFMGLGGKIKTEFGLWKDIVLDKSTKALATMIKYNKRDVALLEQIWKKLAAVVSVKTHAGVLNGQPSWSSPRTGSLNVKVSKTRISALGNRQYQMQCLDDGTYFTISERAHQDYLVAKRRAA